MESDATVKITFGYELLPFNDNNSAHLPLKHIASYIAFAYFGGTMTKRMNRMMSFYLTKKDREALEELSEDDGKTMSEHIRLAIRMYVKKLREFDAFLKRKEH